MFKERIVFLIPEDITHVPAWQREPHAIMLTNETSEYWVGKPVDNPACSSLIWPKYAWVEINQQNLKHEINLDI